MQDRLFELKYTSKQLIRQSKAMEKRDREERGKVKMAIEKGNMDAARIYAENAIRNKTQAANLLRLSSRLDAVANRVQSAIQMQQITGSMAGIVHSMSEALKGMDNEKVSLLMDKFESTFETLDVQAVTIEGSFANQSAASTPADQVETLIAQVAEEHGLQMADQMPTHTDVRLKSTPAALFHATTP
jgi:charged multivesicular body protein 1